MSKGVYCLIIELEKPKKIKIGRLGIVRFKKGYYCYIGSALNNLEKRIERHRKKRKRLHWHIDYLLKYAKIIGIYKIQTNRKIECKLARKIKKASTKIIPNFGCSDCRCISHLYYFYEKPRLKWILKN